VTDWIQTHWLLIGIALVIAVLLAWWLFGRATRTPVRHHRPDVLDEGVAPAQRNQALIDSPIAAAIVPPTTASAMGGLGEAMSAESRVETENAEAEAWEQKEAAAEAASGDDLGKLKGVGPKLVAALHALGVTRYAEIAGWSDADVARIDSALPPAFRGRIVRDNWIEQARFLASDDVAGYEAKFGKL
jgi:predicted flap endonuclease-1-like 5' DNA nuclease